MDNEAVFHQGALQQLMAALRAPTGEHQQQDIQRILQANPLLMAAFTKQRERATQHARDREWEKSLRAHERHHLVNVISSRLTVNGDLPIMPLSIKAKLLEQEVFAKACSRSEYYRLLAEKIRQIESELEDQQLERLPFVEESVTDHLSHVP